jgi:hypothetical protein
MRNIWIFQMAESPSQAVQFQILAELQAFMAQWKAHGTPVPGEAAIHYDRFVVVRATPGHASGCSIDAMQKGVTDILAAHQIQVLGPESIFYKDKDGGISFFDFREAKATVSSGRLDADTIIFDSTLGQTNDISRWEQPLGKTWMGKFLVVGV